MRHDSSVVNMSDSNRTTWPNSYSVCVAEDEMVVELWKKSFWMDIVADLLPLNNPGMHHSYLYLEHVSLFMH